MTTEEMGLFAACCYFEAGTADTEHPVIFDASLFEKKQTKLL